MDRAGGLQPLLLTEQQHELLLRLLRRRVTGGGDAQVTDTRDGVAIYVAPRAAQADGAGPAAQLVEVAIKCDGGGAGDGSTQCSWTYAIYPYGSTAADINAGNVEALATGLTPTRPRASLGAYTAASTGSAGVARFVDGEWVLRLAYEEVEGIGGCVPPAE